MTAQPYNGYMPRSRAHKASTVPYEWQEQAELVEILQWKGLTPVHIPNGGQRTQAGHAIAKKCGEQKGFPDLMILEPVPNQPTKRVYIEMKRTKGGTVSEAQAEWMYRIIKNGDIHILAKGANDAIKQLQTADTGWRL